MLHLYMVLNPLKLLPCAPLPMSLRASATSTAALHSWCFVPLPSDLPLLPPQREAEMDAAMEAADDFGHGFDDYGDGSDDDSVGGGARSAPAQAASRAAAAPTQPKAYPEEEDDDAMADAFDDLLDELEDDRALEGERQCWAVFSKRRCVSLVRKMRNCTTCW